MTLPQKVSDRRARSIGGVSFVTVLAGVSRGHFLFFKTFPEERVFHVVYIPFHFLHFQLIFDIFHRSLELSETPSQRLGHIGQLFRTDDEQGYYEDNYQFRQAYVHLNYPPKQGKLQYIQ